MADFDDCTCRLCWAKFDGPADLAQHEQEEHDSTRCSLTSYGVSYGHVQDICRRVGRFA